MSEQEAGEGGEYANARKLVDRAANREALLKSQAPSSTLSGAGGADFSHLKLKPDHISRPCWTCPDGAIYLESFHNLYEMAYDFLVAIAEPVARPEFLHEYKLTPYSLYAAVATNIDTESIVRVLNRLSKNELPDSVAKFIRDCTKRYGKAKLVLKQNKFYVESEHPSVLRELLRDPKISQARVAEVGAGTSESKKDDGGTGVATAGAGTTTDADGFVVQMRAEEMEENLKMLMEPEDDDDDEEDDDMFMQDGEMDKDSSRAERLAKKPKLTTVAFQIDSEQVEVVKRQAIELDYPLMEEYDFRNDRVNPDVPMDLKPHTKIRRYQERSLSKMFGNGRARSGIIVLPCGAGKTLTGVTAAQTIKKSVVCLCTNAEPLHPESCVLITTYTMISYGGNRSEHSKLVMDAIRGREWGLMLMDEVHVVPAKMFRRVVGSVKAHCRLGLTATLVREDDLISDLNFLIGPKLYEANWIDLTTQGYLANVQCVEVWCPMTGPFMKEYLSGTNARLKQLLYVMNPTKARTVEYLVNFHEARGDKIIVFSDLVYSLKQYAEILKKPLIYGETPEKERQAILGLFRASNDLQTICISKVGDTSIDLPEANVVIQVSSHFGSRRQEAQRLGRILRPKSFTQTDGSNRSSAFNAFFYTLVSTDTQEMFYSAKRQQYLIDQGYTFKIVTNLHKLADEEAVINNYKYKNAEDDRELLRILLTNEGSMEKDQKAEDTAIRKNNQDGAALADASVKRNAGSSMSQLSGGHGMRYKEIGGSSSKRHPLFAKRMRR